MKQRIITAMVALVLILPFIIYGDWPFILLAYIVASLGLMELLHMKKEKISGIFPFIISIVFVWIMLIPQSFSVSMSNKSNIAILFIFLLLSYVVFSKNKFNFDTASFIFFSSLYISITFYFLIHARLAGLNYFLFILLIIWATDTGAYFFGSLFGRRKLWPKISPNKTIEGAVGGILLSIGVGIIFHLLYPFNKSFLLVFCLSIFISVMGQLGDLVASAIKRHYDIKDFGHLLPGHGGILDRLDSLLFVLPLLYLIHFI